MIRIGVYGNNLDTGYRFVTALREMGVEARLFCTSNRLPQDRHDWWSLRSLDPTLVEYVDAAFLSIVQLTPLQCSAAIRALYDRIRGYDVLVCSEEGPALFSGMTDVPKVFFSFGADLQIIPFWLSRKLALRNRLRRLVEAARECVAKPGLRSIRRALSAINQECQEVLRFAILQFRQRRGIRQAERLICSTHQLSLTDALGINRERVTLALNIPMDPEVLAEVASDEVAAYAARFGAYDTLFLHPTRHFYLHLDADPFLKDNDKLLRAYGKFIRLTSRRVLLLLVRKGRQADLEYSERLIVELGLSPYVEWLPELTNRSLRALYTLDNVVVCDQYNPHIAMLGNIGREATYFGRPLITAFGPHNKAAYGADWPPHVFAAESIDEIAAALTATSELAPEARIALRERTRAWFDRNLARSALMPRYLSLIEQACRRGPAAAQARPPGV